MFAGRPEHTARGMWRAEGFSPRPPALGPGSGPLTSAEAQACERRPAGWVLERVPRVRDRRRQLDVASARLWHSQGDASHVCSLEGDSFQNPLPGTQASSSPGASPRPGGPWQVWEG